MPLLFADKLRALRRQRRMTQSDLARHLGLASHSHVSYLERGLSAPSLELVIKAAGVFGVSVDYLLRDTIPVDRPIPATTQPLPPDDFLQHFGAKLRSLRIEGKLTQVDLARQLGLSTQAHVSLLEGGKKTPSIEIVLKCADLFGMTSDEILYGRTSEERSWPLTSDPAQAQL
jgi:transcriptional regulator with XRE-family HTH domain